MKDVGVERVVGEEGVAVIQLVRRGLLEEGRVPERFCTKHS